MMSGPRAAKPDSTGTGVAGLPPDSRYVGTAPSTTRVRSQSLAGSAPLNADKHQGRRQFQQKPALRVGLGSARHFCHWPPKPIGVRSDGCPPNASTTCAPSSRGLRRQPCRQNGSRGFDEPRPQRRAPYKGNRRTCSDGQAPGFSGSSTSSRRKLGKGCRRVGTSRVLSGAGSVP